MDLPIETVTLKMDDFYSRLTLKGINTQQWEHVQTVIKSFDMKKIRELMNTSAIPLFMDFRNIYQTKDITEFKYHRIGQKA